MGSNVPPHIVGAIKTIVYHLQGEKFRWAVGTSCSLVLRGIDVQPHDIDIITTKEGVLQIRESLAPYVIQEPMHVPSERFNSILARFLVSGVLIEIMGDFKLKSRVDNRWYAMDELLDFAEMVEIENILVPVLPLVQSMQMYQMMGRIKDLSKIVKIEEYIKHMLAKA